MPPVVPAKAGIQKWLGIGNAPVGKRFWIPAFAGKTGWAAEPAFMATSLDSGLRRKDGPGWAAEPAFMATSLDSGFRRKDGLGCGTRFHGNVSGFRPSPERRAGLRNPLSWQRLRVPAFAGKTGRAAEPAFMATSPGSRLRGNDGGGLCAGFPVDVTIEGKGDCQFYPQGAGYDVARWLSGGFEGMGRYRAGFGRGAADAAAPQGGDSRGEQGLPG